MLNKVPISILILTKNEEANLPACLQSVSWADDVVVYDSESTDRTRNIALEKGARVIVRPFDNWSSHQNWAVQSIKFKNPWVFYLDADERCDGQLRTELEKLANTNRDESAFRMRRKDYFMGRWLRHSQIYPTWLVRVFRPEKIRYERLVNPVAVVDGSIGELDGHLIHEPFSHGVSHWFDRHNRYSSFEAEDLIGEVAKTVDYAGIFSSDATRRRRSLKHLAYCAPGRPMAMFLYLYVLRFGFLDGVPGYYYSLMRSAYELMIDVKVREKRFLASQKNASTNNQATQ